MSIDYKLAGRVIDNAINYAKNYATRGIDSLVGGNHRLPALAYAGPGSDAEAGHSREMYHGKGGELPSIDAYVRDSSTSKPVTNPPTAKRMLYEILNFF